MPLSLFDDPDDHGAKKENDPLDCADDFSDAILVESLRGAEGNPPVTVNISSRFVPILDEPRDLPKNPHEALKKLLCMWWNNPQYAASQKSIADCFGETPALYYYALAHFSDSKLGLSDEEREDLRQQLCHHSGCLAESADEAFERPDNRILEFYWYFLVRLITIEDEARSKLKTPLTEEHLSMIYDQYAFLIARLSDMKRNGFVTIPSVTDWLEKHLLTLGTVYPHLKPYIAPLLKAEYYDEATDRVRTIQQRQGERYMSLFAQEQTKEGQWAEEMELKNKIKQTLSLFREAMTPEVHKRAWTHPLDYIADQAMAQRIVCIEQAYPIELNTHKSDSEEDGISRMDTVELRILSHFPEKEHAWIFANAQARVCPFHDLLEKGRNPKSLSEVMKIVETYVNGYGRNESIQGLLELPYGESNEYVQYCIAYWEAIRSMRRRNRIYLFNELLEQDRQKPLNIIPAFQKTVVLDNGGVTSVLLQDKTAADAILMIHHQMTCNDYPEDHVCVPGCLGYIADELGNKHGRGEFESSVISLNKNMSFIETIFESKQLDQIEEFLQIYAILTEKMKEKKIWICKDMILFTKSDDDEHSESPMSPVHSDSYVPVG